MLHQNVFTGLPDDVFACGKQSQQILERLPTSMRQVQ
jgi:hypothetical protein